MFTKIKGQQGFTLIELMIVVAIIGILAAIAIPNFILYQLKSQQAEGRTNLAGVKTSQVAFSGEQGCYGAMLPTGAVVPATGVKSVGVPWPATAVPAGQPTPVPAGQPNHCVTAAGLSVSPIVTFATIGFQPTGLVRYSYAVDTYTAPQAAPAVPGAGVCMNNAAGTPAAPPAAGFVATTASNLDGDALANTYGGAAGTARFLNNDIQGVIDCSPQVF